MRYKKSAKRVMKIFSIIVAMDEVRGIGKAGELAWHLPPDLRRFKEITSAVSGPSRKNAVVMGRKTWESLPVQFRPLPGRLNVVLTGQQDFLLPDGVRRFKGFDEALEYLNNQPDVEHVFCIGGAQMYACAVHHPACSRIFATYLQGKFDCDAFFPVIPARFRPITTSPWLAQGNQTYRFIDYAIL